MTDTVKVARVKPLLQEIDYPVSRTAAATAFDGFTLVLADGEANLGDLIDSAGRETFESADDLTTELNNVMPIEAVGEPGQSDGDA
ncbi:hypothetical protein EGH24_04915 [Halonotius terrestris]|uniref:Uncharacterized protein n=1 Tax=Halonotius terrestris TaxID=2487750 RepID=A0A8J8P9N7_9EURY|nr:hypothetical protein [Halonotius terrestris]TQQ82784.1 hypothetical protein EGH24_04915 [Halonotius terrestris]